MRCICVVDVAVVKEDCMERLLEGLSCLGRDVDIMPLLNIEEVDFKWCWYESQ